MNPRHPLTFRYARTARETQRNPYDWWEGTSEPVHVVGHSRPLTFHNRPSLLRRLARLLGF